MAEQRKLASQALLQVWFFLPKWFGLGEFFSSGMVSEGKMEKSLLPMAWTEIPALFRSRLGSEVGRQREMVAEGHLLLVLHGPPEPDEQKREGRLFWRKPNGMWLSNDAKIKSVSEHLDDCAAKLAVLDNREEKAKGVEDYAVVIESLTPLHRTILHLHQVLQNARQAMPDVKELIDLRDRAYALERSAGLLYDEAKHALEFWVAMRAEEQARNSYQMAASAHRLNLMAAFFFPFTLLVSLSGVAYNQVLEKKVSLETFLIIMGVSALGGLLVTMLLARPPKQR